MSKILIVEDDQSINDLMYDALTKNGYVCTRAFSGSEGVMCAMSQDFDLILMDLMLPGVNGAEASKRIHEVKSTPIIIVSAIADLDSKVNLLTSGAVDYITKPFEIKELLARVLVQIRRNDNTSTGNIISHGLITLDRKNYSVTVDSNPVNLTKQEFKILELLVSHPDRVFSKQDIYEYAWDDIYIGEDKTLSVHISNIRQKLKKYSSEEFIKTVWGIGFKLA